jgi:hypothetical protein
VSTDFLCVCVFFVGLLQIFQGEEMSIGIRGFSIGYDFYAPERSVCFHHYAVGKNAKIRNKVHHFWENNQYAGYVLFVPIIIRVVVCGRAD